MTEYRVGITRIESAYTSSNASPVPGMSREEIYCHFEIEASPSTPGGMHILGRSQGGPVVQAILANGQSVAVKLFTPTKTDDTRDSLMGEASHEFRRSARDMGPLFVRSYALLESWDLSGGPLFLLVMELVHGSTLSAFAAQSGLVPVEQQVRWTTQMLNILEALENDEDEVVYQDLKPDNVMLSHSDATQANLVVVDHASSRSSRAMTKTGIEFTAGFNAPEIIYGIKPSYASDRFSAGATLLSTFTENTPWIEAEDIDPVRRPAFARANLESPLVADEVRHVLAGMLVKDPERRPGVAELKQVLAGKIRPPYDPYSYLDPAGRIPLFEPLTQAEPDLAEGRVSDSRFTNIVPPDLLPSNHESSSASGGQPSGHSSGGQPSGHGHGNSSAPREEEVASAAKPTSPPVLDAKPIDMDAPLERPAPSSPLIRLAGVNPRAVHVRSERRTYRFIAWAMLVYGAYLLIGVGVVGYQATSSVKTGIIGSLTVGPILAFALINLDRSIVDSSRPKLKDLDDPATDAHPVAHGPWYWFTLIIRVLVTIAISFVIGDAVNVQVHERDAMTQITANQAVKISALDTEFKTNVYGAAVTSANSQVATAIKNLATANASIKQYGTDASNESAKKGATRRPGCGPQCNSYLQSQKAASNSIGGLTKALNTATMAQTDAISAKKSAYAPRLAAIKNETGPLARAKALFHLATHDAFTGVIYFAIIFAFMAIELSALLIKLSSLNNVYERTQARAGRARERQSLAQARTDREYTDAAAEFNSALLADMVTVRGANELNKVARYAQEIGQERPSFPLQHDLFSGPAHKE